LNEKFQKDRMDENMKRARFKMYKGYRWRSRWHDNEVGHLLDSIRAMLTCRVIPFVISVKRGTRGNQRSCKRSRGSGREERRKSHCRSLITASHDHASAYCIAFVDYIDNWNNYTQESMNLLTTQDYRYT